jgi:hypothetical protein
VTVQTIDATPAMGMVGPYVGAWEIVSTGARQVVHMSKDRTTLYGKTTGTSPANRTLIQSKDDGVTWTTIKTFTEEFKGISFTDDGEAMAVTQGGSASPGYLYKTTGWATDPLTCTWTKVLTTRGGYINPIWGMHRWSSYGSRVVTCEYGSQNNTDALTAPQKYATQAYLSEDYGVTWRAILDLSTLFPGTYPLHVHAVAYDPYWDRIWLTYGDTASHLTSAQTNIMYTDDLGATWVTVPLPPDWTGAKTYTFQDTTIFITEKAVGFMPDGVPYSPNMLNRTGYRTYGALRPALIWAGGTGAQGISMTAFKPWGAGNFPLFLSNQGKADQKPGASVYMSPDGHGETWVEIYRVPNSTSTDTIEWVFGPTVNGWVFFSQGTTMRRAKVL